MNQNFPQIKEKTCNIEHNPAQVNLCKLGLKRKGLSDEQIDLLENNIRTIINKVLDNLEDE